LLYLYVFLLNDIQYILNLLNQQSLNSDYTLLKISDEYNPAINLLFGGEVTAGLSNNIIYFNNLRLLLTFFQEKRFRQQILKKCICK